MSRVTTSGDVPDPIDDYLDRLLAALPAGTPGARRFLIEAEDHLRDAVADAIDRGVPPDAAAFAAIACFGPPRVVARAFRSSVVTPRAVITRLVRSAVTLGVVGLLAIGVSGVIAQVMRTVAGPSFVASDPDGVRYTASRCADFRRLEPRAASCADAAVAHHADEIVSYRLGAGVVGLAGGVALGVLAARRRRRWLQRLGDPDELDVLPGPLVPAVGAAVFGLAGAGLALLAGDAWMTGAGPGQFLSAAIVAAAVAAVFAVVAVRRLVVGDTRAAYATV